MQRRTADKSAKRNPGGRPRKYSDEILVDAALRVMEREGYAALSIRSLAKAVGTTHATLYNYIGSIEEVEAKALQKLSEQLPLPSAATGSVLRAEFLEYLGAALRLVQHHPGILLSDGDSPAGKALNRISDKWQQALRPYVVDPKAGHLILGLISSVLIVVVARDILLKARDGEKSRRARLRKDATSVEKHLNELIDLLLPGMVSGSRKRAR